MTRKTRNWLLLICMLSVTLRAGAALLMGDEVVELPGIHDQISYHALALRLLDGHGYSFDVPWYPFTPADTPTAQWSFVYPAYLAGVYLLFGVHPLTARLIQAVITGLLTTYLIYRLGNRVFGRRVGLVAASISAIYTYFIYYGAALMTESFFTVAALLSMELAHQLVEKPSAPRALALGLCLGLAVLLRQAVLLFVPILLAWLWWTGRRKLHLWHYALPLAVIALLIFPWTMRNYRVYGHFLLLNANAGYAFYSSNNPELGIRWSAEHAVAPVPADLTGLTEAEMDRALLRRGIDTVLSNPSRFVLLTLNRFGEYFKFWPSTESSLISNIQRPLSFGLLLPLTLLGLYRGRRHLNGWTLPLLFFAVTAALYLLSWPTARYRVPTDASLMPLAALALVDLAKPIRWFGSDERSDRQ